MSRPETCKPEEVYERVKDLPKTGILRQNSDGAIFVDIDDEWIFKALDVLKHYGFIRPPFFVFPPTPIGAHITVINKKEAERKQIFELWDDIDELGKKIKFEIVRCFVSYPRIEVSEKYGIEANYKIRIESPQLDTIRRNLINRAPPQSGYFILVGVRILEIMGFLQGLSSTDEIEEEDKMEIETEIDPTSIRFKFEVKFE